MSPLRLTYLLLILCTIIFGLLSRKVDWLPLATGDALYAVMMYWVCRFLFPAKEKHYVLILSILFCFLIEFLQLSQHPLFIEWRNDPMLRLIFGQGFLWSDMIAYIIGAIVGFVADRKILNIYFRNK